MTKIYPGNQWKDTQGVPIQAHGGGVLYYEGVYYWYGENKAAETTFERECIRHAVVGVSCYSSRDLLNWENRGIVLPPVLDQHEHDLHSSKVVERPKVIYNKVTKQFVMYMHIDKEDYTYAAVGVALCDTPTGTFEYLGSYNPNNADSRDMTVFQDDDGKAYLFHSSEWNKTMYISPLTENYLMTTGEVTKIFIDLGREAPAIFKRKGLYYIVTSGCSGWDPNEAEYATATNILGPWKIIGNPCTGKDADKTFYAQSTFVIPVQGKEDAYIFMADQWNNQNLRISKYVWLPIEFNDENILIDWKEEWDLSIFK